MDTSDFASSFGATLPHWVAAEIALAPDVLATDQDRMRVANRLAERNHWEGSGGPFAALVVASDTGQLISAGVNLVLSSGLSGAHAEVVALSLAQTRLGKWDLGHASAPALELVVNWRPCIMCYGAVMWSGIRRLVIAGDGPELEKLTGFDEGPMREDWISQFRSRGIDIVTGVLRDEAIAVFRGYGARSDATVYNARGGDS